MRWLPLLVLIAIAAWLGGVCAQDEEDQPAAVAVTEEPTLAAETPPGTEETTPAAEETAAALVLLNTPPALPRGTETAGELARILAQDKYQGEDSAPRGESLWARFWARVNEWLSGLGVGTGNLWSMIGAGVALIVLLVILVRLLWQLATRTRQRVSEAASESLAELSADDLVARAAQAFKRGEFRLAVRYRYLALLRDLDLPAATLLTNSQVLRLVGKRHPRTAPELQQLVVCYEDAWYGGAACLSGDYELADRLAGSIRAAVVEEEADATGD